MTFAQWLKKNRYAAESRLSPKQRKHLLAAFRAEKPALPVAKPVAQSLQAVIDHSVAQWDDSPEYAEKRAQLRALGAQLQARGASPEEAALALLRESRMVPALATRNTMRLPARAESIAAALAITYGLNESQAARVFAPETMQQAMGPNLRGCTLHGLFKMALAEASEPVPAGKLGAESIRRVLQISQQQGMGALGPSTVSVPGILMMVTDRTLLASYSAISATWPSFCRVGTAQDFRPMRRYRLGEKGEFELVSPSGEIKHGALQEEEQANAIRTYGKLIALTREMIINDDLGAFTSVPTLLARMAATRVEKLAYETLLGNAGDFFATGNGNLLTGSPNKMTLTGLGNALKLFRNLLDPNGTPILATPTTLLVPPALEAAAMALLTSTGVVASTGDVGGDTLTLNGNIYAGKFKLVVSPYLGTQAGLAGASDTAWYLLCNEGDLAPVEMAFLHGNKWPTLETMEFDTDRLGVGVRCYHDFGAALADKAAAVKSDGLTADA